MECLGSIPATLTLGMGEKAVPPLIGYSPATIRILLTSRLPDPNTKGQHGSIISQGKVQQPELEHSAPSNLVREVGSAEHQGRKGPSCRAMECPVSCALFVPSGSLSVHSTSLKICPQSGSRSTEGHWCSLPHGWGRV